MAVLPIRKSDQEGNVALRDGLTFAVFIRRSHEEIAASVGAALEQYLEFGGPAAARWIQVGDEYRPFDARRHASVRKQLRDAPPKRDYLLTIAGGSGKESDVAEYKFVYGGEDLKSLAEEYDSPLENSFLEIWYPTDVLDRHGVPAFLQHLFAVVGSLPFSSGYCSLALHFDDWAAAAAEPIARALAVRHPGLDLHYVGYTAMELGDRLRGAYWLTLLGEHALAELDMDSERMQETLGPEIQVHVLPRGIALQAGERPEPGDVNRGQRLPLARKVARLIEPLLYTSRHEAFGFVGGEFLEWERRHLR